MTALEMITHAASQLGPFFVLTVGLCFFLGLYYAADSVFLLWKTSKDPRIHKNRILITAAVGACLMALPVFTFHMVGTFFTHGQPSPLTYTGPGGQKMVLAVEGIENFIQLIGWIAIARGLVILKRVGDGTTRETSDKGFVHIIGGAMAANVVGGAILFAYTFGLTLPI